MSIATTLLDLPQEILIIILREHCATINVSVNHRIKDTTRGIAARRADQAYHHFRVRKLPRCLSVVLICRALYETALNVFHNTSLFHYNPKPEAGFPQMFYIPRHAQHVHRIAGDVPFALKLSEVREISAALWPKVKEFVLKADVTPAYHTNTIEDQLRAIRVAQMSFRAQGVAFRAYLHITASAERREDGRRRHRLKVVLKEDATAEVYSMFNVSKVFFSDRKREINNIFGMELHQPPSAQFHMNNVWESDAIVWEN